MKCIKLYLIKIFGIRGKYCMKFIDKICIDMNDQIKLMNWNVSTCLQRANDCIKCKESSQDFNRKIILFAFCEKLIYFFHYLIC